MNFKQKELINELFEKVKQKYPETRLIKIMESPEDPRDLWIWVSAPDDEDREIELMEFASELETDILLDYGYSLSIMTMPEKNGKHTTPEQTFTH